MGSWNRRRPGDEIRALVAAVGDLEPEVQALDDAGLQKLAADLRERARSGQPAESLAAVGYALVREAARRALGERPYDVQIEAGLAMLGGAVVEMQTGEGKTLAAVAPVFVRALSGQGAHVLTFNDYLAGRDADWMGPVYARLGLSVGCVQSATPAAERRAAYAADVTYLTAREAGFDLLRDQLALEPADQVQRPFRFALVDEADSILVDEARVPLIIAGDVETPGDDVVTWTRIARHLDSGDDYETDEHGRNVFLTETGVRRVERELGCDNLFESQNAPLLAGIRNALHAEVLLTRDVDYLVRHGAVEQVDEFTGRVADRRRWPDGLQAAVEAKESLHLRAEGTILGSITLQHLIALYPTVAGMTGTAAAAADELHTFYGLDVVTVPTHRPNIRLDRPDAVFTTAEARDRAVIDEIGRVHASGRPVLVGTATVRESERLAARLRHDGVDCRVLNARHDDEEAAIVARAGRTDAVTISTNMAGRGTDIRLGADAAEGRRIAAQGGLYVIGTNRHESRRIDDQLRGRAGRQGDPGETRFFVSLEDPLLVRYGIRELVPDRILPAGHDGRIEHALVRREVARAQRRIEGDTLDVRRRLWDYASLLERQRQVVAEWRQDVLEGREPLDLLERRAGERWHALRDEAGEALLEKVERRLTLLAVDRCWSEHLAELERLRDEMQLVSLDGRTPLVEYCRIADRAFDELLARVDREIVAGFERLPITPDGVDWDEAGLAGPSATWTYLVNDTVFGSNLLLQLSVRPTIFLGAIALWPALFVWGLYQHWLRRKQKRAWAAEESTQNERDGAGTLD